MSFSRSALYCGQKILLMAIIVFKNELKTEKSIELDHCGQRSLKDEDVIQ